ncbi:MAG: sugar phosphate isomerase/epimerase [Clostridia bacterium]|nr:sugar phosphate isomerase/epimerase [Clostridia bacterium]
MGICRRNVRDRLIIATMCADWQDVADRYGLGVEGDYFCQAENMDGEKGLRAKADLAQMIKQYDVRLMHAPFNELHPAAIDPRARALAMDRLNQAAEIAIEAGIKKMVVHSGYVPFVYFKEWHHERSVEFWKEFMADKPEDFEICIENVLDDEPGMLVEIVKAVDDKRVGLCLDVGHANILGVSPVEWLPAMAPYLKHLHIHNNDGAGDFHDEVMNGNIDMEAILDCVISECDPQTTVTLEILSCEDTLDWLMDRGYYK